MSDDPLWQHLLLTLYASVTDAGAAASLPGLISRWAGGTTTGLWITDQSKAPVEVPFTDGPAEGAALYAAGFYRHDPWAAQFFAHNTGKVIRGSDSIADRALDGSVFYNEFGRHFGLFHQMNTTFALSGAPSGTPSAGGPVLYSTLSVLRAKREDAFSDEEIGRLQRLVPHLKQAMSLRSQIDRTVSATRTGTLAAFVEALPLAACVLHGSGRVLHANGRIDAMQRRDGGLFARTGGEWVVTAPSAAERTRLLRLVSDAASGLPGGVLILSAAHGGADGQALQASVTPLPPREARASGPGGLPVLLVLRPVGVPDRGTLHRTVMEVLGFTEAEAGVASALATGRSPQEIAADRGTRISTVRTLLVRAQEKAGAANLRQLVGILTSLSG